MIMSICRDPRIEPEACGLIGRATRLGPRRRYVERVSQVCGVCGRVGSIYCDVYDAYLCASCDRWLEDACSDPECPFCARRPGRPSKCRHTEPHFDMAE